MTSAKALFTNMVHSRGLGSRMLAPLLGGGDKIQPWKHPPSFRTPLPTKHSSSVLSQSKKMLSAGSTHPRGPREQSLSLCGEGLFTHPRSFWSFPRPLVDR